MVKNPTVHFFKTEGRGVNGEIPKTLERRQGLPTEALVYY